MSKNYEMLLRTPKAVYATSGNIAEGTPCYRGLYFGATINVVEATIKNLIAKGDQPILNNLALSILHNDVKAKQAKRDLAGNFCYFGKASDPVVMFDITIVNIPGKPILLQF